MKKQYIAPLSEGVKFGSLMQDTDPLFSNSLDIATTSSVTTQNAD